MSVVGAFMIMSFYGVVSGWTLHYAVRSFFSGSLFNNMDFKGQFVSFTSGYLPVFWQAVVMLLVIVVVAKGISGGIEKNLTNI